MENKILLLTRKLLKDIGKEKKGQTIRRDFDCEYKCVTGKWTERKYDNRVVEHWQKTNITMLQNLYEMKQLMLNAVWQIKFNAFKFESFHCKH